jgi:hypothetical protein
MPTKISVAEGGAGREGGGEDKLEEARDEGPDRGWGVLALGFSRAILRAMLSRVVVEVVAEGGGEGR